ncbi:Spc98 family-domain-containing protein [Zychaea mexicana]|uniref:Spc98 family-domain-containing protein n=1 Tax=Zychaea mexicana TaxID=64656 RepID=UPI0022FE7BC8|nr:Spc98 family-domain-containing protein [Zychaea mexicana]KAI9492981.1 Spc98 family-domain-containing protein [Zychaea mexicana]
MQEPEQETNNLIPTLKPLDQEIKLVTDFYKTLDTILLCHPIDDSHRTDKNLQYIPVLHTITDQSVHQPLAIWCPLVNESAMKLFIEKFHIQAHFELIRRFFLFGDDRFTSAMVDALFSTGADNEEEPGDSGSRTAAVVVGIKLHGRTKQWPPRTSDLNMSLRAVLLESLAQMPADIQGDICKPHQQQQQQQQSLDQATVDIDDVLTFGVREEQGDHGNSKRWCDARKIDALDFLCLQYRVPYPLDIIINNRTLDKYNRMFTFLLQLHRINATVKYIYQKLRTQHHSSSSSTSSPLQLLQHRMRFQVGQFVNTLSGYVYDTAIHSTWLSMIKRIQQKQQQQQQDSSNNLFQTMDPIMFGEYHEHVLDRMLYQCFLKKSQQPIKHMLNQVFEDVLAFAMVLDEQQLRQRTTHPDGNQMRQQEQLLKQFMEHAHQFIKVLSKLHDRGIGRLGNVMNSRNLEGSFGVFGDFHDKLDAKSGQGAFAQELLTRLDINQNYLQS